MSESRAVPAVFGTLSARNVAILHVLAIVAFAAALRLPYFGNPAIYIDEQFYLLAADRWLHDGLIPYIDIWDRKPIGIFVIYAVGEILGDPVIGYQVIALLCVIGTALLLWALTSRVWGRTVGLFAALFYCVSIMLMDGQGGQSPVFYNFLVAAAAYLLIGFALDDTRKGAAFPALGAALLLGLGLQVKYSVVFEAAGLSLFALFALARRHDWHAKALVTLALGMMVCGLAPTVAVGAAYAAIGHWQDFVFANFLSILAKDSWRQTFGAYVWQFFTVTRMVLHLLVPTALLGVEVALRHRSFTARERWMLSGLGVWLFATFAGAMIMGKPAPHYFLPTVMPLAILSAIALQRLFALGRIVQFIPQWPRRVDLTIVAALMLGLPPVASFVIVHDTEVHWGSPALINRVADVLKDRLQGRCLYVFNRVPIFYHLTQACIPTRYPFPNHLNDGSELHALPDDALTEFARVLATTPVLLVRIPSTSETDPVAEEMLNRALAKDYVLARMIGGEMQTFNIYVPR